jgi:uncharacterized protein YlbG (UPF0298 family)
VLGMEKTYCDDEHCFCFTSDERIHSCIERSKFVKKVRKELMEKRLKDKFKVELKRNKNN